jgi:hypothetical protein
MEIGPAIDENSTPICKILMEGFVVYEAKGTREYYLLSPVTREVVSYPDGVDQNWINTGPAYSDDLLSDFVGKKVRVIVEVIEDEDRH